MVREMQPKIVRWVRMKKSVLSDSGQDGGGWALVLKVWSGEPSGNLSQYTLYVYSVLFS